MELTIKCLAVDISVNKRGQIVVTATTQNKWSVYHHVWKNSRYKRLRGQDIQLRRVTL